MTKKGFFFREKAVKNATASPELDQLVRIVPNRHWVLMGVLWSLVLIAIAWSIFGRIPFRVSGEGLLLSKDGSVHAAVAAAEPGRIKTILVKPNDIVKKGQLVASLQESELRNELHTHSIHLQELENRYQTLNQLFGQQIAEYTTNIDNKNASLQKGLEAELKSLKELETLFKVIQNAYEQQLETKRLLTDSASNYYAQQSKVEAIRQEIVQNKINLSQFIDQKQAQLRELDFNVRDQRNEINKLQKRLMLSEQIISPVSGVVTSISKNIGDLVKKGDVVVRIANVSNELDAVVFVSSKEGKKIKPGMSALVSPTNIKKEEYGSIRGKVNTVSEYPVTQEAMMAILHNQSLVNDLSKNSAPIAVRIHLSSDRKTRSGFSWSSSQGPDEVITPGTSAIARITINQKSPLRIIVPVFKNLWGAEK